MSLTLTDYDAVLKDYYTDEKIKEQTYAENPLFAMIPKERAGGRRIIQPVEYGNPGGASANYNTAATNAANVKSKYADFLLTWTKQYQRIEIDNQLLYSTDSPRMAFRKAFDEFDRTFRSLGQKIGRRLYRTAGGRCGQLAIASTNTTTLSFVDKADLFNVQIGDNLQFAAADGTGSLRASGAVVNVTAVDYEANTITIATNLGTTVTGVGIADFVFLQDDFGACLSGFEDWVPGGSTRATVLGNSFYGTVRSVAPEWLGGIQMDGTAFGGVDEVMIKLVGRIAKYGGMTSHIFANPETLTDLQLTTSSKMFIPQEIYTTMKDDAGNVIVGFSGFKVQIGGRTVRVYGDRNCPSNRIWAIQMDTFKLWHAGEPVNWLGEEWLGQRLHKTPNADTLYADLGNYSNVGCSAPAWNGSASITPST